MKHHKNGRKNSQPEMLQKNKAYLFIGGIVLFMVSMIAYVVYIAVKNDVSDEYPHTPNINISEYKTGSYE